ncbi:MAG: CFI-box-CTERM domain-containing protein [Thermoplasmata archaeon]
MVIPSSGQAGVLTQAFCDVCGRPIERSEMEGRCIHCGKLACKKCGRTCSKCSVIICQHCWKVCTSCGLFLCSAHAKQHSDGRWYCDAHLPPPPKQGPCFIATAAYGTPMAEEINVLRNWRDDFLLSTKIGTSFVNIYYKTSPPIADFVSSSNLRKAVVRAVINPIVLLMKKQYGDNT